MIVLKRSYKTALYAIKMFYLSVDYCKYIWLINIDNWSIKNLSFSIMVFI